MAVLLETSKGDIVLDLLVQDCPLACKNFLKLCKVKYYNNCIFHNVQRNFIVQTGDPTATGKGGTSVYGLLYGEQARFFEDEIRPHLKHKRKGVVGMASAGKNLNASQFYITTGEDVDSLDERHTIFGQVAEGFDVLDKINEAFCDDAGRPLQNIRIRHTIILEDPFEDQDQLEEHIPEQSPEPEFEQGGRLEDDWAPDQDTRPAEEVEQETRRSEAHNRAVVLEMIGDLPEAEAAPPSNMLFVCKLNQVTTEEDLEIIFSRFGKITSCDIIRDWKTGDSLCYAFIGLDSDAACEEAYFKMNNVLIDDRRIKVDFSQSVHHLWKQFKKGGRKGGNASMAAEAAGHERDTGVAEERLGAASGRLEFKGQLPGRGGSRHGGGGGHHMMLDDEPEPQNALNDTVQAAAPAPARRHGGTDRERRDDRQLKSHRERSRSRSREGRKARDVEHAPQEKHRDGRDNRADSDRRGMPGRDYAPSSGRYEQAPSREPSRHSGARDRERDEREWTRDERKADQREHGRGRDDRERHQHEQGRQRDEQGRPRDERDRGRDEQGRERSGRERPQEEQHDRRGDGRERRR